MPFPAPDLLARVVGGGGGGGRRRHRRRGVLTAAGDGYIPQGPLELKQRHLPPPGVVEPLQVHYQRALLPVGQRRHQLAEHRQELAVVEAPVTVAVRIAEGGLHGGVVGPHVSHELPQHVVRVHLGLAPHLDARGARVLDDGEQLLVGDLAVPVQVQHYHEVIRLAVRHLRHDVPEEPPQVGGAQGPRPGQVVLVKQLPQAGAVRLEVVIEGDEEVHAGLLLLDAASAVRAQALRPLTLRGVRVHHASIRVQQVPLPAHVESLELPLLPWAAKPPCGRFGRGPGRRHAEGRGGGLVEREGGGRLGSPAPRRLGDLEVVHLEGPLEVLESELSVVPPQLHELGDEHALVR
mmetsp:Transcript_44506/g.141700  ORF Transcript_44506/g.141700 Transcript_44506/m.141700 type:complete len:349 (-) Transcript_44506:2018-3064(-)